MRNWLGKAPGKEAKLSYSGNLQVENRNGLIVNAEVLEAERAGRARRGAGDAGAYPSEQTLLREELML